MTTRILALPGSLRADSCNRRLLDAAVALAPDDVEVAVFEHLIDVPLFNQDTEDPAPAGVTALRTALAASDALLIATPEYNGSVPGVLKNALDWLSRGDTIRDGVTGRPTAVIGATPGMWGTRIAQDHTRQILSNMGANVTYAPRVYLARAFEAFEDDGSLVHEVARTTLTAVLDALHEQVKSHVS
jgi:chromate reductase